MSGTCPACGSTRLRVAFRSGEPSFYRCRDCGSLHDPEPSTHRDVRRLYGGREYFVKASGPDTERAVLWGYPDDYLADRANVEAKFDRVLSHLERYVTPGRLLDVGSGPGFLLTVASRRGWEPVGLDINEWAAEYGRKELGVDVRAGTLHEAAFPESAFDALTMMDLIEHVPDPGALVSEAARVVRPGGALAILTPDAGAVSSRALGHRWPEVRRPGEHTILFSVEGLSRLLTRNGFVACAWHSIGKIASLATLAADVSPVAPSVTGRLRAWLAQRPAGSRIIDFDPRTKFCLYARRLPNPERAPQHRPARIPKRPERLTSVGGAILRELEALAAARRYCDWMFAQFAEYVRGRVAEVGAGIGTFSARLLAEGPEELLLIEPDPACAAVLERRFGNDRRARLARDALPEAESLAAEAGRIDLIVCQNVLEHIGDDEAALQTMTRALRPGGHLALIVPAGPRLYGPLDDAYGHWRRYTQVDLEAILRGAGLEVETLRPINALGILGWWAKNRRPGAHVGSASLAAYEALLPAWCRIEKRLRPPSGLSLVSIARKIGP